MYDYIHYSALLFGLFLAPVFYTISWLYRRRFKNILIEWKKTQLVVFTILTFLLNLTLFILACFFFASHWGNVAQPEMTDISQKTMRILGIDCLLYFTGVILTYLGVQNFYIQYISRDGIIFNPFSASPEDIANNTLFWGQIKDYFVKADYPITYFHFIIQLPDNTLSRRTLKVPFYALPKFEALLESSLQKQQELRAQSRSILKNMSRN